MKQVTLTYLTNMYVLSHDFLYVLCLDAINNYPLTTLAQLTTLCVCASAGKANKQKQQLPWTDLGPCFLHPGSNGK